MVDPAAKPVAKPETAEANKVPESNYEVWYKVRVKDNEIVPAGYVYGGSVDLDAELSWNWEAGLRGSIAKGLKGDATMFVMDFSNQIVSQSVAGGIGTTLTSAGRTLHRGAELSLTLSSRDGGWTDAQTDVFARAAVTWVADARFNSTRIATVPCFDGAAAGTLVATGAGPAACGVARDVRAAIACPTARNG